MTAPSGSISVIGSVAPVRLGSDLFDLSDCLRPPMVTVRHIIANSDSERDVARKMRPGQHRSNLAGLAQVHRLVAKANFGDDATASQTGQAVAFIDLHLVGPVAGLAGEVCVLTV